MRAESIPDVDSARDDLRSTLMFPLATTDSNLPYEDWHAKFPVRLRFGQWYVAVVCSYCETLTALFVDASEGRSQLNGSYLMKCPRCKQVGDYQAQHYQHQERRRTALRLQIL